MLKILETSLLQKAVLFSVPILATLALRTTPKLLEYKCFPTSLTRWLERIRIINEDALKKKVAEDLIKAMIKFKSIMQKNPFQRNDITLLK